MTIKQPRIFTRRPAWREKLRALIDEAKAELEAEKKARGMIDVRQRARRMVLICEPDQGKP